MRVTRKTLQAQNSQFRAQLAVHDNVSRATLNECVIKTRTINKELEKKVAELQGKLDTATCRTRFGEESRVIRPIFDSGVVR